MLQSSGLLSSVSHPKNGKTSQISMKMDGAKAIAPVFSLLHKLERSLRVNISLNLLLLALVFLHRQGA